MFELRFARFLASVVAGACLLSCGQGVSSDPLGDLASGASESGGGVAGDGTGGEVATSAGGTSGGSGTLATNGGSGTVQTSGGSTAQMSGGSTAQMSGGSGADPASGSSGMAAASGRSGSGAGAMSGGPGLGGMSSGPGLGGMSSGGTSGGSGAGHTNGGSGAGVAGMSNGGVGGPGGGNAGSGGVDTPGAGRGGMTSPTTSPNGTPNCTVGNECTSGVCLPDVAGTRRCCASDCRASGRVCSTSGECVCSSQNRDVGGECLLIEGQSCRDGLQCASNHCRDAVCCDSECDGVCERCDAPNRGGQCLLYEEDPACVEQAGFECTARRRCRLPLGEICGKDADCESDECVLSVSGASVCCTASCDGVCERCGASGACNGFPATDSDCSAAVCPASTPCLDYRPPVLHACSANGQCAGCEPVPKLTGLSCGVGKQCDGSGACKTTGTGRVAAGERHTCAIRDNGNVVCWGKNDAGQLGAAFDRPFVGDDEAPADVPGLELDFTREVVQVAAGFLFTCVLFDDGNVRCWGKVESNSVFGTVPAIYGTDLVVRNSAGFVDPLLTGDVRLPGPALQISAAAGGVHACAVLRTGDVVCWGYNGNGQCGNGTRVNLGGQSNENLPRVALGAKARQVKVAAGHSCALLQDGSVVCWGEGTFGRLGYGDSTPRLAPVGSVPIGEPVTQIAVGSAANCVLLAGGRVRCWGRNNQGQLGYGHTLTIGDNETPEQAASLPGPPGRTFLGGDLALGGGGGVVELTTIANDRSMCARFVGGAVRCWGFNDMGQLGYGHALTLGVDHTPDQLVFYPAGSRNAAGDVLMGGPALALADGGRCALRVDQELYCWGQNTNGELGLPQYFPLTPTTPGSKTLTPEEMGPVRWE